MTDYEKLDKVFADRNRRTHVRVTSEGAAITDLGQYRGHFFWSLFPVRFKFNTNGQLVHVAPRLRGWWLLRGTGVRRRARD